MVQALLDCRAVHLPTAGEGDVILQGDGPGAVSVIFPGLCQPGFQFHGVGVMHQGFADAVANAGPAVVGAVGINGLFPVFGVEGGVANGHDLLGSGSLGGFRSLATAARQQRNSKAPSQNQGNCFFHFLHSIHL